jgi:hypothetical protein
MASGAAGTPDIVSIGETPFMARKHAEDWAPRALSRSRMDLSDPFKAGRKKKRFKAARSEALDR